MSATAETLRLLTSIDESLKAICAAIVQLADKAAAKRDGNNDRICDGPHGDPLVRAKDPKDWTGEPMKGKRFSECPPDYLDMLAERFDYFASREEDATKQKYNLLDARRARAWAARLRAGWTAPVTERVDESKGEPTW
jgi:hypothetical protein